MNNTLIVNAILSTLSSFLSNSGAEIAKSIGKDIYEKLKHSLTRPSEQQALARLEAEPFSSDHQLLLETILLTRLPDKEFSQDISRILQITPSNFFIFELVLQSIQHIKAELRLLYRWWINAGTDKKGEYQNRIEQLEQQLLQLEEKFFATLR
jgi:hypothetical protein